MAKGRKPTSNDEKIAKGETRPSRVNYEQPEIPAPDSHEPPKELKGAGLALWKRYAKPMIDAGQLRSTDMPMFLQHCKTESEIETWEKELRKRGLERSEKLAIERLLEQKRNRSLRQSMELGITPVSRSKVRTVSRPPAEKSKNNRFFKKGKIVDFNAGRENNRTPAN